MKMFYRAMATAFVVLFLGGALRAEQIELVDGSKINGTIVGYEGDMFRVQTDFGFALVRKDRVTSISFPLPAPKPLQAESKEKPSGEELAAEKKKEAVKETETIKAAGAESDSKKVTAKNASAEPAKKQVQETLAQAEMPDYLFETVRGNTYINNRFKFAMYKPPTWIMFNEIRQASPTGVMAMGTADEQTILFVELEPASGDPVLHGKMIDGKLRRTYRNYRVISDEEFTVDGREAIRRTFRGILDGVDWYGMAVHVKSDDAVIGIIGLTSAESYQFKQAVFNKIVKTFHFTNRESVETP